VPAELDARQHAAPGIIADGRTWGVQELGDLLGRQQLVKPTHRVPSSRLDGLPLAEGAAIVEAAPEADDDTGAGPEVDLASRLLIESAPKRVLRSDSERDLAAPRALNHGRASGPQGRRRPRRAAVVVALTTRRRYARSRRRTTE
jgi:hypothetical protein